MRELKESEIDQVSGAIGLPGAVIGAIVGGGSAAINGGSARQVAFGATFGALSGATGGLANGAMALSRLSGFAAWGVSAALGLAGAGVVQTPEIAGQRGDEDGGS